MAMLKCAQGSFASRPSNVAEYSPCVTPIRDCHARKRLLQRPHLNWSLRSPISTAPRGVEMPAQSIKVSACFQIAVRVAH